MIHIPVLQKEVLHYLNPKLNEHFIDCTVGEGGHTAAILRKNKPRGKVLAIETDPEIYKDLKDRMESARLLKRLILVNDSYANLAKIVEKHKFGPISGVLLDLGMSSWHLAKSGRGFTFQKEEPLNMLYSKHGCREKERTAEKIINECSKKEIERILKEYGQERFSEKISEKIVEERKLRPIRTTLQLVEVIKKAVPKNYEKGRIHSATRTFQALRIAANDELNNLRTVLPQVLKVLGRKGRVVVISFHSLEDRIVKNFLKESFQKSFLEPLTKKVIVPSEKEIKLNPRSRSAKLRAAIRLENRAINQLTNL